MLTKTSSAPGGPKPRKPLNPWACALINVLAFPGLGTIMSGRRVGWAQATIMVIGFILTMGFMFWYIASAFRMLADPGAGQFEVRWKPYAWAGESGLALCVISWFWALVSSISIVSAARKNQNLSP